MTDKQEPTLDLSGMGVVPREVFDITETAQTIFTNAATQLAMLHCDQTVSLAEKANIPEASEAMARAAFNLAQDFHRTADQFKTEYMNALAKKEG